MAEEDVRQRTTAVNLEDHNGVLPSRSDKKSASIHTFAKEVMTVLQYSESQKICIYGGVNILTTILLLYWCNSTNSMALTAFTYVTIFDMFLLCTGLITVWVKTQKPSSAYTFGYERFEVVAVFASTLLAQLGSFFIIKESVERLVQQPDVQEERLFMASGVAFTVHMIITYTNKNEAFEHVINASSSSWLQEHVSDLSESLCHLVPGVSKLLLPRLNPFSLIGVFSTTAMLLVFFLIQVKNYHAADTWAAIWIAIMTVGTMFPMSAYTGKILLQTTPSHSLAQLDKCIREAQTLDGVLEFRQEHFWTLSFGTMAGSVQVRVRRDADEQMVLAHVYHRLANLVPVLTVHIFKDDWISKSANYALGGDRGSQPALYNKPKDPGVMPAPLMTSTPANTPLKLYSSTGASQIYGTTGASQVYGTTGASQVYGTQAYDVGRSPLQVFPTSSTLSLGGHEQAAASYINTSNLNPNILNLLGSPRNPAGLPKFQ